MSCLLLLLFAPTFQAVGMNATLHFKIQVNDHNLVRICGYSQKESLKHALFFIDPNVTEYHPYVPSSRVTLWKKRKYGGDECSLVQDLPRGDHVLTVVCISTQGTTCSVTHIVMY